MFIEEKPAFVRVSEPDAPLDCVWEGASDHIGPTETVTPLVDRLSGTTTCAQIALCAGVLLWGTWRLRGLTQVEHNLELAEAAFAYCVDWRYVDVDAGPKGRAPHQPPEQSAMMQLNRFMRAALSRDHFWDSFFQPVFETFHSANIVHHILKPEDRPGFDRWLDHGAERIKLHFPKPADEYREYETFDSDEAYNEFVAPHRGIAVPPQLLNPDFDFDPHQRTKLMAEFLVGLNPDKNRYLRKPEAMLELGFAGMPYQLGDRS
ncbi:hypothetical protein [Nocardia xishanensis]|uniref:Uncharacterized protein n=1 Tax=Nocardia xishanensis TaxID=238964 RepID=A0ABW7X4D3_9NOCA